MNDEPDLRRYLQVVRRQAALVVAMTIAAALAALAVSLTQDPRYEATATMLYAPAPVIGGDQRDHERDLATLKTLATTDAVLERASREARMTADALRRNTSVSAAFDADLLRISASAGTAQGASRTANAVAGAFAAERRDEARADLETQLRDLQAQLASVRAQDTASARALADQLAIDVRQLEASLQNVRGDVRLVEPAKAPSEASSPKPPRDAAIGAIVGLLLGIAAALVRDRLDRRLRTVEQVEDSYALPTLGLVPRVASAARGDRQAGLGDYAGSSSLAEAYRTIRTNLSLFRLDRDDMRVIVVSSAVAGEGKSAATANLAVALASSGRRVLAVSADIRSPTLHHYFSHEGGAGVIDVLSEQATLDEADRFKPSNGTMPTSNWGELALLSNDRFFSDPATLYQSGAMARLLEEARRSYDVVLLDAPPLLFAGEASVLAQQADAVILVSRVDGSTRDDARRALNLLRAAGITPLGLIVTNVSADGGDVYSGYGYGARED